MKNITLKSFAVALAFLGAALFAGCSNGSDENEAYLYWLALNGQSSLHPASGMTKTQTAAASTEPITVDATTKRLVLSGAEGKTIYMARTNPSSQALKKENTRTAKIKSEISASLSEELLEAPEFSPDALSGLFKADGQDPHKIIYEDFWKKLKDFSPAPKNLAMSVQNGPKNYSVGDTETFNNLKPEDMKTIEQNEFELLVSEDDYYVWVKKDDAQYNKDTSAFTAKARELGEKFINGYKLVSHIYGEPSKNIYLYDPATETFTKDEALSTYSKTGEKINILFYEMLEKGHVYGFVSPIDFIKGYEGSNEGRFLYLDSKTLLEEPMEAYSTSLHEFSHAISFTVKSLEQGLEWTYWYGEFLAMLCEDMMQDYLGVSDSDVDGDLGNTPKGRLCTANYTDSWGFGLTGQNSATYASAFLLGSWISRKFGGVKFLREVARNNSVDMKSILDAIKTAAGKSYTETSLLQEFAGDMLVSSAGSGHNQNAATYPGDELYTCAYTDSTGSHTYEYPVTAINLWAPFYGWCDLSKFSNIKGKNYISNASIPFSGLPAKNTYKKHDYSKDNPPRATPTTAYLGPLLLTSTAICPNIGPYGSMLFNLGTASSDSVTIEFKCVGGHSFSDVITIYVK